jgi:hypothetical protein
MEVHAHTHTARKKWTHYFWEFLMLFLAVTLGFFVENQREHYIERQRAKEFAEMLMDDLKKDTIMLNQRKKQLIRSVLQTDTLVEMITRREFKNIPADSFYYYNGSAINVTLMNGFAEATIQQLKSSGSLRYFTDNMLKKKISEYDIAIRNANLLEEINVNRTAITVNYITKLEDYKLNRFYNHYLLGSQTGTPMDYKSSLFDAFKDNQFTINNPDVMKEFTNFSAWRIGNVWFESIKYNIDPTLKVASELIEMLKEKYHFK